MTPRSQRIKWPADLIVIVADQRQAVARRRSINRYRKIAGCDACRISGCELDREARRLPVQVRQAGGASNRQRSCSRSLRCEVNRVRLIIKRYSNTAGTRSAGRENCGTYARCIERSGGQRRICGHAGDIECVWVVCCHRGKYAASDRIAVRTIIQGDSKVHAAARRNRCDVGGKVELSVRCSRQAACCRVIENSLVAACCVWSAIASPPVVSSDYLAGRTPRSARSYTTCSAC